LTLIFAVSCVKGGKGGLDSEAMGAVQLLVVYPVSFESEDNKVAKRNKTSYIYIGHKAKEAKDAAEWVRL